MKPQNKFERHQPFKMSRDTELKREIKECIKVAHNSLSHKEVKYAYNLRDKLKEQLEFFQEGKSEGYKLGLQQRIVVAKKDFIKFLENEVKQEVDIDLDKIKITEMPLLFSLVDKINNQNSRFKEKLQELKK